VAPQEFTLLLVNWRNGDKSPLDEMTPMLYDELRRVECRLLAAESPDLKGCGRGACCQPFR